MVPKEAGPRKRKHSKQCTAKVLSGTESSAPSTELTWSVDVDSCIQELMFSLMCVVLSWPRRLFNYGIGIHLLKDEECSQKPRNHVSAADINPRSDHVSFQVGLLPACVALSSASRFLLLMKRVFAAFTFAM